MAKREEFVTTLATDEFDVENDEGEISLYFNVIQGGAEKKLTTMQSVNIVCVNCCSTMVSFLS